MRGKLIVGNWKMNGGLAANATLLGDLAGQWQGAPDRQLAVCVPYPYLVQAQAALQATPIAWGAQDVSEHASGAYTGEVSATMLGDFGCRYAIVGHSERRQYYGDTDAVVAAKAKAALAGKLVPIVCVGELLAEREAGSTDAVVLRQLEAVLAALGADAARVVVAYEPVWAIGTGKTATPEQAQEMHGFIRRVLAETHGAEAADSMRILYGGSVKPDNIASLMNNEDVDGALVGGASLEAGSFSRIVNYK